MNLSFYLSIFLSHLFYSYLLFAVPLASEQPPTKRNVKEKESLPKTLNILEELHVVESRTFYLLELTPPNGHEYCKALRILLDREINWLEWKKDTRCKEFERNCKLKLQGSIDTSALLRISEVNHAKKRNIPSSANPTISYITSITVKDISLAAKFILRDVVTYEKHIESYLEAEDPDNGIDEEYHPKNDTVYCWRARRLLADHRLSVFSHMSDGDIGSGLKHLVNESVTAKLVELVYEEDEVETEELMVDGGATTQVDAESKMQMDELETQEEVAKGVASKEEGECEEEKKGIVLESTINNVEEQPVKKKSKQGE